MNIDYNLLKTFAKVSELGGFTKAAKVLNQPKSRVSRAISRLENELGVELIRRTTRKTTLTSVGQEFYERIAHHLTEINDELIKVSNKQEEMVGTIRITASDSFAQYNLIKIISDFNKLYPKVKFDMVITNDYVDIVKENIDIAFRAGKLQDSTLIQKKFTPTTFVFVCSKEYVDKHSMPKSMDELAHHRYLSFKPFEKHFVGEKFVENAFLATGSLPMLLNLVLNGDGIALLPEFVCNKFLESKELIRVIPSWQSKRNDVHILYAPTKNQAKRMKEFIEFARNYY